MATGLEVAAGVAALLDVSDKLYKACKKLFRPERILEKQAERLKDTVFGFSDILSMFCTTFQKLEDKKLPLVNDPKVKALLTRLEETAYEAEYQTLESFKRIHHLGRLDSPLTKRLKARFIWIVRDEQIAKELILTLNADKLDINMLNNILSTNLMLVMLDEQRAKGENPDRDLINEIKRLTRQNKNLKVKIRETRQELRELRASQGLDTSTDRAGHDVLDSFSSDVQEFCHSQRRIRIEARRAVRSAAKDSSMSGITTLNSRDSDQLQQRRSTSINSTNRLARDFNQDDTPPNARHSAEFSVRSLAMVPATNDNSSTVEDLSEEESPATTPDQEIDGVAGHTDDADRCPGCQLQTCAIWKEQLLRRSQPYRMINHDGSLQHRGPSPGPE